jgi:hypothetical protein
MHSQTHALFHGVLFHEGMSTFKGCPVVVQASRPRSSAQLRPLCCRRQLLTVPFCETNFRPLRAMLITAGLPN